MVGLFLDQRHLFSLFTLAKLTYIMILIEFAMIMLRYFLISSAQGRRDGGVTAGAMRTVPGMGVQGQAITTPRRRT